MTAKMYPVLNTKADDPPWIHKNINTDKIMSETPVAALKFTPLAVPLQAENTANATTTTAIATNNSTFASQAAVKRIAIATPLPMAAIA